MTDGPNTGYLIVGLRWRRSQAKVITNVADELRRHGIGKEHISLFDQAAAAAAMGEPLRIHCTSEEEAHACAAGFVRYGIARPAIEDLGRV